MTDSAPSFQLHFGDCLEVMAKMEADSVDSIITDPPYGLKFMGKGWDHGVPGVPYWKEALRVVKPGAMMFAFGGTRTHHRLMCAIEDAGWEIRDTILWLYSSGWPKNTDISKAIDKAAGKLEEREVVGEHPLAYKAGKDSANEVYGAQTHAMTVTAPATDAAALWEGWGTALSPSHEPIIVAMAPRDGTFVNNALKHGVAGLNIDGGRIPTGGRPLRIAYGQNKENNASQFEMGSGNAAGDTIQGRWPKNVVLSHHPECVELGVQRVKPLEGYRPNPVNVQADGNIQFTEKPPGYQKGSYTDPDGLETVQDWDCHPDCAVRMLAEQSGERPTGGKIQRAGSVNTWTGHTAKDTVMNTGDKGTATRFYYCAKAPKREKWFYCAICEDAHHRRDEDLHAHGKKKRERDHIIRHPTQKPLALMEYLCRLISTPTGGVTLDLFAGTCSTGEACFNTGMAFIGIENDMPSFRIGQARLEYVAAHAWSPT